MATYRKKPVEIEAIQWTSKTPTSAKEMFLSKPKPYVSNMPSITKLTHEQLNDLGLIK